MMSDDINIINHYRLTDQPLKSLCWFHKRLLKLSTLESVSDLEYLQQSKAQKQEQL